MCCFIVCLQSSNGTGFWVYVGETVQDVAMGICLFVLMGFLTVLIYVSPFLVEGPFGVPNTFFLLAGFQGVTVVSLFFFMKETKGLTAHEKQNVFRPKPKSTLDPQD